MKFADQDQFFDQEAYRSICMIKNKYPHRAVIYKKKIQKHRKSLSSRQKSRSRAENRT